MNKFYNMSKKYTILHENSEKLVITSLRSSSQSPAVLKGLDSGTGDLFETYSKLRWNMVFQLLFDDTKQSVFAVLAIGCFYD